MIAAPPNGRYISGTSEDSASPQPGDQARADAAQGDGTRGRDRGGLGVGDQDVIVDRAGLRCGRAAEALLSGDAAFGELLGVYAVRDAVGPDLQVALLPHAIGDDALRVPFLPGLLRVARIRRRSARVLQRALRSRGIVRRGKTIVMLIVDHVAGFLACLIQAFHVVGLRLLDGPVRMIPIKRGTGTSSRQEQHRQSKYGRDFHRALSPTGSIGSSPIAHGSRRPSRATASPPVLPPAALSLFPRRPCVAAAPAGPGAPIACPAATRR